MKTFFLQVWHPGSSSASRANFSRHVFSYIRHFRTLSRSARKTGSKNAKNRKNRVSARYHCNSSQLRLRFGLTHQIRNVARFSANILWNFQPWLQSKNSRLILGEKTWFKAKNVILEVSTFFLEYNFFSVFRPNQYFFTVYDSLLNVEGADEKDYLTYRHCRRDNLVQTLKIWLFFCDHQREWSRIFTKNDFFGKFFFSRGILGANDDFSLNNGRSGGGLDIKLIFWTI